MKLIDSHAHVNFAAYKDDYSEVIARAASAGVYMINVGTQYTTSEKAIKIAHEFPESCWAAVGTHPVHLKKGSFDYADSDELDSTEIHTIGEEFDYQKYLQLAKDAKVVAIGEVGLDYHHFDEEDDVEALKDKQKETLKEFIKIANEVKKPVMIHCWDGYADLLAILAENPVSAGGVIHSFIGSYKTAKKFVDLGFLLGVNGIATYSDAYDKMIRETDIGKLIVETDCPYLAPGKHKGERNEPILVGEVVKKIADVKQLSEEAVAEVVTNNTIKLFNLK